MTCVTTISYAVLVNSQSSSIIFPTRGIHLRDPISPYLYLICTEGLNLLLNEVEKCFKIKGLKVARGSQTFNYMFFVDYNIVLCRANIVERQEIQRLLETYKATFGQGINKHGSRIFFNLNTCGAIRDQILDLARVSFCSNQERCL